MQNQRKKQWIMITVLVLLSSSFLFFLWRQEVDQARSKQEKAKDEFVQLVAKIEDVMIKIGNDIKTEKKQVEEDTKNADANEEDDTDQKIDKKQSTDTTVGEHQPSDTPNPKEPSSPEKPEEVTYVTIRIDASNILSHMDKVSAAVVPFIPKNGVVLADTKIEIKENDSVFSILQRVCEQQGISLDATNGYVRYLHDFGEFDAGNTSGWLYTVNGSLKSVGAAAYKVKENDVIVWHYTVVQGDVV